MNAGMIEMEVEEVEVVWGAGGWEVEEKESARDEGEWRVYWL